MYFETDQAQHTPHSVSQKLVCATTTRKDPIINTLKLDYIQNLENTSVLNIRTAFRHMYTNESELRVRKDVNLSSRCVKQNSSKGRKKIR